MGILKDLRVIVHIHGYIQRNGEYILRFRNIGAYIPIFPGITAISITSCGNKGNLHLYHSYSRILEYLALLREITEYSTISGNIGNKQCFRVYSHNSDILSWIGSNWSSQYLCSSIERIHSIE